MASANTYVVPIDFSRGSEKALDFAIKLARERRGKVIALHVVPADRAYAPVRPRHRFLQFIGARCARKLSQATAPQAIATQRLCAGAGRGTDFAAIIARHANKLHAFMIVMGSHGRTGLSRLLLGSVAERTLRYSKCPVLIVK